MVTLDCQRGAAAVAVQPIPEVPEDSPGQVPQQAFPLNNRELKAWYLGLHGVSRDRLINLAERRGAEVQIVEGINYGEQVDSSATYLQANRFEMPGLLDWVRALYVADQEDQTRSGVDTPVDPPADTPLTPPEKNSLQQLLANVPDGCLPETWEKFVRAAAKGVPSKKGLARETGLALNTVKKYLAHMGVNG